MPATHPTYDPHLIRHHDSRGSNSTLDEPECHSSDSAGKLAQFGHPLERMVHVEMDDDFPFEYMPSSTTASSACSTASAFSDDESTSSCPPEIDFEKIINEFLSESVHTDAEATNFITLYPKSTSSYEPIMIKRFPRASSELLILLELNCAEARSDPWNPAPRIISAVDRDEEVFLCFEPLIPYNQPPFTIASDYINFFMQCLEGIASLHDQNITGLQMSDPSAFRMDIGSWSLATFDRALHPVRYYFTDFSKATSKSTTNSGRLKDVQDCGLMFDEMLAQIPQLGSKLSECVGSMKRGELSAEEAHASLETLCKSLDGTVFDIPTSPQ